MRAAFGREVKISRQQLQIAHDQIAFEHETLLMTLVVEMRIIGCTGQGAHERRAPLRNGILEQNRIRHSGRHLGPNAGAGPPGQRARHLLFADVDGVENRVEKAIQGDLPPSGEIECCETLLPKLDFRL
jgi:hypothetical protein